MSSAKTDAGKRVEAMSEDEFQKTIDAIRFSQDEKDEKFEMTKEEQAKFEAAAKDPEFRSLFAQYVDDISDPKHREEQNAYLKQMEEAGQLPPNKKLIHPESGFVIKTHKANGDKVFVNIVQSDQVEVGSERRADNGVHFQLPHILGPVRLERDKKNTTVSTYDCCFHPTTVQKAKMTKPFCDMISTTTFEAIEKVSEEKLQRTYHILRGVVYKTGDPQSLIISDEKTQVDQEKDAQNNKKKTRRAGAKKKKSKQNEAAEEKFSDQNTVKQGLAAALRGKLVTHQDTKPVETRKSRRDIVKAPRGGTLPTYSITERDDFDLSQHELRKQKTPVRRRPKELVIAIEIPLCDQAKGIDSDFDASGACLKLTVNDQDKVIYSLDAPMPYPVLPDQAKAQFSAKTHILKIIVPVIQEKIPVEVFCQATEDPELEAEPDEEAPPLITKKKKDSKEEHSRWLADEAPEPRKPFASDAPLPTAVETKSSSLPEEKVAVTEAFVAKERFEGALDGFVFKLGKLGLGYYRDQIALRVAWKQQSETLILILEQAETQDLKIQHLSPTRVHVEVIHAHGQASFELTTRAALNPNLSRYDIADDNCVLIFTKVTPEMWPVNTPKKKSVAFNHGAIDTSLMAAPSSLDQLSPEDMTSSSSSSGKEEKQIEEPPSAPAVVTTTTTTQKPDLTPIAFKNTLLFEID